MTVHTLMAIMLKLVVRCAMPTLALMMVGCEGGGESSTVAVTAEQAFAERFRQEVTGLARRIDTDEYHFRQSANALFKTITGTSIPECRDELACIYAQTVRTIQFDVENMAKGDEKENSRLDSRLRNLWNISEWAAHSIFLRHPESLEGWNLLINVVLKYREAATVAGKAMEGLDVNNSIQHRKHRRYFMFKREMMSMSEAYTCTIGWMYEACRQRLTPQQRQNICREIKAKLGELPPEMTKDEPK